MQAIRAGTIAGLDRGGKAVAAEAVSLITSGAKTGRVYTRDGVKHQASAPGESPAGDTGDLAGKIGTSIDEGALVETIEFYSAHARPLEYGTAKMAPRPFARVAVVNKRGEITADIADEIGKALR